MNKLAYYLGANAAREKLGFQKLAISIGALGHMAAGAGVGALGGAYSGDDYSAKRILGGAGLGALAGAGVHGVRNRIGQAVVDARMAKNLAAKGEGAATKVEQAAAPVATPRQAPAASAPAAPASAPAAPAPAPAAPAPAAPTATPSGVNWSGPETIHSEAAAFRRADAPRFPYQDIGPIPNDLKAIKAWQDQSKIDTMMRNWEEAGITPYMGSKPTARARNAFADAGYDLDKIMARP